MPGRGRNAAACGALDAKAQSLAVTSPLLPTEREPVSVWTQGGAPASTIVATALALTVRVPDAPLPAKRAAAAKRREVSSRSTLTLTSGLTPPGLATAWASTVTFAPATASVKPLRVATLIAAALALP